MTGREPEPAGASEPEVSPPAPRRPNSRRCRLLGIAMLVPGGLALPLLPVRLLQAGVQRLCAWSPPAAPGGADLRTEAEFTGALVEMHLGDADVAAVERRLGHDVAHDRGRASEYVALVALVALAGAGGGAGAFESADDDDRDRAVTGIRRGAPRTGAPCCSSSCPPMSACAGGVHPPQPFVTGGALQATLTVAPLALRPARPAARYRSVIVVT